MKTTLTRLFTVALLMMISIAAGAQVKVLYGKTGNDTFTGGKISATQEVQKDGQVAVTFTIKPDNVHTFTYTKTSLVIVSVYDPSSKSSTRADEVKVSEPLSVKGTEGTISYPNYGKYTVTVDPNLGVWVQTVVFTESNRDTKGGGDPDPDYSGTFYIGSHGYNLATPETNYYLCPTEDWCYYKPDEPNYDGDGTAYPNPFLTTYQCKDGSYSATKAEWIIEKTPSSDYYYIKQRITGKYLVSNGNIAPNPDRIRVHLELIDDPTALGDKVLFDISPYKTYLVIRPMGITDGHELDHDNKTEHPNHKWLTVNGGNVHSLKGESGKGGGPGNSDDKYKNTKGIVCIFTQEDVNADFYLEDIIMPVIEQQNDNKIAITCSGCAIYYTTDNTTPDPNNYGDGKSTKLYDAPFAMTQPITTVKAVAVKAKGEGEALDTYSRIVSLTTQRYIGSSNFYLFQNVECTDYYMIPGDVVSNNTTVNTSSLYRPSMSWYFLNAGSEDGVQYYYIINGSTGDYLYRTGDNVYMKASSAFNETNNYKFSIEQGYDADSNPVAGFNIIPKGVTNTTYCIYKNGYADPVLANAKPDVVKGGNSSRDKNYGQWNIISAPDNKLPASLTYNSSDPSDANWPTFLSSSSSTKYFKIENVGAEENYMNPPDDLSSGFVAATGTSSGGNDFAWYVVEADHDGWQKYYYIIHALTGKYLYFTQTIPDNPKTMQGKSQVIALRDYDNANATPYQFVFAKTTEDGAYYIVPKGLTEATYSKYYALYRDGTNPIKSNSDRNNNVYKWKFVSASLFCNNPEFVEEDGKIKIKCNTNAAKIYINTESNAVPTIDADHLYDPTNNDIQNWVTTDKVRIKAIAIVSDGVTPTPNTVSSAVVTLLNKPDITLTEGGNTVTDNTYTYDGTAHIPIIGEVSITQNSVKTTADASTYIIGEYLNNTNAGAPGGTNPPTVKVADANNGDVWYILNASKEFTIKKVPLTVTAKPKTITYGDAPSGNGVTYSDDFVEGESETDLGGTLDYDYSYTQYGNVGNYTITPNGLTSDNYEISFVEGTLTVEQKEVGLEWTNTTLGYNGSAQAPTATATGTVNNDVIGVTVTLTAQEGSQLTDGNAVEKGSYTATAAGLTGGKAGNYKLPAENTTTFRIINTLLTITANDHSITYGDAPGNNGVTKSDPDAVLSGELTYSYDYEQYGNVGAEYTITPGGVTSNDYEIVFVAGKLTVSQKVLEVEWTNTTLEYSGSEQAPTATIDTDGLVNNDEIGMTVALTAQEGSSLTTEGNAVNAGSYTATATLTGDKAGNYQLSPPTANFIIEPKSMTSSDIKVDITKGSEDSYSVSVKDGETPLNEGEENDYTFVADAANAKYYIVTVTGKNNYKEAKEAKFVNVVFSKSDEKETGWAATFIIDRGEGKFSTPTGFTPHIVTGITSNAVNLTAISYIPERVPVLLLSDSDANGFVAQVAGDDVLNTSSNLLKIDDADKTVAAAEIYILYKGEFVLNMAGTLPAKRIYLPRNTSAGARLMITSDQSTGIVNLQTDKQEDIDKWYSLDGRRLNGKPTKKGLYIKNGQKAVVK